MTVSNREKTLALSLVSHTNIGKTTLARTLLRRDVGEVLDQAHVTDLAEVYTLLETDSGARLELWDTPGFGDSVRLLRALRRSSTPFGWFQTQVWDRYTDRPFWCSQQAVHNVREDADVVLYLVNAAEEPEGAGYVGPELEILEWAGRPVLILLNQTGENHDGDADVERWRAHVAGRETVLDVLDLDAFTRCWVQEGVLLERVEDALPEERRPLARELFETWRRANVATFHASMEAVARYLAGASTDREPLERRASVREKKQAMEALGQRLDEATRGVVDELIELHGLEGASAGEVRTQLEDFALPDEPVDSLRAGALGGALGGALTGLVADIASAGLTFGGGFVTGAILGGLGSVGLARAFQVMKGDKEPAVTYGSEFLDRLAREAVLRYLAVAHYGRGRGEFRDREHSTAWIEAVDQAFERRGGDLGDVWLLAKSHDVRTAREVVRARLEGVLVGVTKDVFLRFYPETGRFL